MFELIPEPSFFIAMTFLTMVPGADTMIVIRNSLRGGIKDGLVSSLGICCGLFFHATVTAVGLAVILVSNKWLFNGIKTAGAFYLIWLGVSSLIQIRKHNDKAAGFQQIKSTFHFRKSFREGLLSNILNPKTIVFYMAFLPQFINLDYSPLLQTMIMASLHFLIATLWQGILALAVDQSSRLIANEKTGSIFNALAGLFLVFFGVMLLVK